MASLPENVPQVNPLDASVSVDPTILAEVLSDRLTWIVSAKDDARRLREHGFPVVCIPAPEMLTKKMLKSLSHVIVLQRPGPEGAQFGVEIKQRLQALKWSRSLTRAFLPDPFFDLAILAREAAPGRFAPYLASLAAGGLTETIAKAKAKPWEEPEADTPAPAQPAAERKTLAEVVAVFQRWLHLPDPGPLYSMLGTIAANRMAGDPVWLMLIGGPGWGKTEILLSGSKLEHMHIAATLTEASLLSGTRSKERSPSAKGGLLKQIGAFGFLVLKDFTSILSMNRDLRTGLLAALREIYDGSWTRHVGVDGGLQLSWSGKLALIGGCTGTIDRYHAVIGAMGERFVFYRWPEIDGREQARRALKLLGKEAQMRAELSAAVQGLFAGLSLTERPGGLNEAEQERLIALSTLVVRCRSAVERDSYSRDIELIPDPEAPGRLTLTLARLYAGLRAITVAEGEAWDLVVKIGFDCLPVLRWRVLKYLLEAEDRPATDDIATALGYPTQTTRRTLEDLAAHGVILREKGPKADRWYLTDWTFLLHKSATDKG